MLIVVLDWMSLQVSVACYWPSLADRRKDIRLWIL